MIAFYTLLGLITVFYSIHYEKNVVILNKNMTYNLITKTT